MYERQKMGVNVINWALRCIKDCALERSSDYKIREICEQGQEPTLDEFEYFINPASLCDTAKEIGLQKNILTKIIPQISTTAADASQTFQFVENCAACGLSNEQIKELQLAAQMFQPSYLPLYTKIFSALSLDVSPKKIETAAIVAGVLSDREKVNEDTSFIVGMNDAFEKLLACDKPAESISAFAEILKKYHDRSISEDAVVEMMAHVESAFENKYFQQSPKLFLGELIKVINICAGRGVNISELIKHADVELLTELNAYLNSPNADLDLIPLFKEYTIFKKAGMAVDKETLRSAPSSLKYADVKTMSNWLKNLATNVGEENALFILNELSQNDLAELGKVASGEKNEGKETLLFVHSGKELDVARLRELINEYNVVWINSPRKAGAISQNEWDEVYILTEAQNENSAPVKFSDKIQTDTGLLPYSGISHEKMFKKLSIQHEAREFIEHSNKTRNLKAFNAFIKKMNLSLDHTELTQAFQVAQRKLHVFYPTGEELLNIAYGLNVIGEENVVKLNEKFGLVKFGRFSPHQLKIMADSLHIHKEYEKPLFVVVDAVEDANGAFYADLLGRDRTDNLRCNYDVSFFETAAPKIELIDYLEKITAGGRLVDSIMLRAHGLDGIAGYGESRRAYFADEAEMELNKEDVAFFESIKGFLKPNAKIYIISCTLGEPNSFAQAVSETIPDAEVHAPNEATAVSLNVSPRGKVKLNFSNGFDVFFRNGKERFFLLKE